MSQPDKQLIIYTLGITLVPKYPANRIIWASKKSWKAGILKTSGSNLTFSCSLDFPSGVRNKAAETKKLRKIPANIKNVEFIPYSSMKNASAGPKINCPTEVPQVPIWFAKVRFLSKYNDIALKILKKNLKTIELNLMMRDHKFSPVSEISQNSFQTKSLTVPRKIIPLQNAFKTMEDTTR